MLYASLPATPLFGLRREIDRLFDDTFLQSGARPAAWAPAADVREDEKSLTITIDLPGLAPDQVELTAEKGVLTVKGERPSTHPASENAAARWHLTERVHGTFKRTFRLPAPVDENAIEAAFSNGVLTVRIPKAVLPQARKIEIRAK